MSSLFFEERYQARRSYRKSCDRCHASKLKCASLDPADPFSECVRCNKARLPCSYSPRCAKPAILQHADTFGDRSEDHNSDVIFATVAPTVLYGHSPIHANGSGVTLEHAAKPSTSSISASSTDLESGLSTVAIGLPITAHRSLRPSPTCQQPLHRMPSRRYRFRMTIKAPWTCSIIGLSGSHHPATSPSLRSHVLSQSVILSQNCSPA